MNHDVFEITYNTLKKMVGFDSFFPNQQFLVALFLSGKAPISITLIFFTKIIPQNFTVWQKIQRFHYSNSKHLQFLSLPKTETNFTFSKGCLEYPKLAMIGGRQSRSEQGLGQNILYSCTRTSQILFQAFSQSPLSKSLEQNCLYLASKNTLGVLNLLFFID